MRTIAINQRQIEIVIWFLLIAEASLIIWLQRPWIAGDSSGYLELARNIQEGQFTRGGLVNGVRAPLYPLLLSLTVYYLKWHISHVILFQVSLYLLGIYLIYRYLIHDQTFKLTFLLVNLLYIFPLFYCSLILAEALAAFTVSALVMLLERSPTRTIAVLMGATLGCGALIRPDLLPAILAVVVLLLFRRQYATTAEVLSTCSLTLLPFMLWNLSTFGNFTPLPVNSTVGQSLYVATWELELGTADLNMMSGSPVTEAARKSGFAEVVERVYRNTRDDNTRSERFKQLAFQRMAERPVDVPVHAVRAVWRLFNTATYPAPPAAAFLLHVVSNSIWLFGLIGMVLAIFRRDVPLAPLLVFLAILAPHLFLHTEARYTTPIRPILMLYAAYTATILQRWIIESASRLFPARRMSDPQRLQG